MRLWVPWAPPGLRLPLDVGVVSGEDAGLPPGGSWAQGRSPEAGAIPRGVTPSCLQLQGRRVPPSSPWRCPPSLARPLPPAGQACVLCAWPVCSSKSGCPLRGAPWEGKTSSSRSARAPRPGLRPPPCPAASRGRGGSTSGKPCPAAAGCPCGQGAKGGPFFCWVAPAGKAAQAETGAQISGGHTGPGPPSGPFCT